jgi:L-asparaginase II
VIALHGGVPLVEVVRSGVVEGVHCGHLVVVDARGDVVVAAGDPAQPVFPRSSSKPLQAVGMRRLGLDVPADQLALAAASHSGEARHAEIALTMLAGGGFTVDDLGCPHDWPLGDAAREAWIAAGGGKTRLRMNCSGKHAAMLLTSQLNGWATDGYLRPGHPLQQALHDAVADIAGEPIAATAVDGCGAPLFAFGLVGLARAFARLATAADGAERDVASAMREHPDVVAGSDRSATRLMVGVHGLIAKDGAEGVYAAALPDGSAVAVKIDDGALRAAERVVVAGLGRLGADAPVLDELAEAPVLGGSVAVGTIRMRAGIL